MRNECDLPRILEQAYAAFAEARPPREPNTCSHCWSEEATLKLLATAPRDLTIEQVDTLAPSLGTTFGGERETRWFAPRLVASLVEPDAGIPPEYVGGVLRFAVPRGRNATAVSGMLRPGTRPRGTQHRRRSRIEGQPAT